MKRVWLSQKIKIAEEPPKEPVVTDDSQTIILESIDFDHRWWKWGEGGMLFGIE